ncbi:MAG: metallophosphoesterase [Clostridia bacterium]|nr:metallophosphoesterase [Clostridia bacterium]
MALFAMGDLHLPLGINKPMDIFGRGWENYVERIYQNWNRVVATDDTVLICGDFSWATYLEESIADFEFLHSLPGRKIISKGNHDYWWSTASKLTAFKNEHGFDDVEFLHNNAVSYGDYAICAARGWKSPFDKDFKKDDEKIYEREIIRLELSVSEGKKISDKIIVMLHFPPDAGITDVLEKYGVEKCVYGHLHGVREMENEGRDILVASDFLGFEPLKLLD